MGASRGKKKFDWSTRFDHGGKSVYVNGSNLGASGESMLRGAVRENNYGRAEIALLGNTVRVVKVDGAVKFNRDKGQSGADIPSWYDEDRGDTTAERILTHIVTHVAPHLADQYDDAFGMYYDDEAQSALEEEDGERDPTESHSDEEPTEYQDEAEM